MPLGYLCCSCCGGGHILEEKKVMCVCCCIGCVEEHQCFTLVSFSKKGSLCHDTWLSF